MEADMRRRFLISLALAIPIFLYSPEEKVFENSAPTLIQLNGFFSSCDTGSILDWFDIHYRNILFAQARKLNMAVLIAVGVLTTLSFQRIHNALRRERDIL